MADKIMLGYNVLVAAQNRIAHIFNEFSKVYVSFSGGKDSTVMLHLVLAEAMKRKCKVGVLFVDLEGQYKYTIDHVREMYSEYAAYIDAYWVCAPIILRNAVSQFQPRWVCWDPAVKESWVREMPAEAYPIHRMPFVTHGMEFEEFVPKFGAWYAGNQLTACFVGIRTAESLNRWRTIASSKKNMYNHLKYTTWVKDGVYNVYPIYDWKTEDIWAYIGKTRKSYNKLYDRMYQAGLTIHQARICQPYGDDQRKGLWLFQVIEPETWGRIVSRVNGANQGALYAQESGNILGRLKITKPARHTWESFSKLLLESMPAKTRDHFEDKISVFIHWWGVRGYSVIPDELPIKEENAPGVQRKPSWRRICKALLRNDYWCKGLSFSQTTSENYAAYKKVMRHRRQAWGLFK